VKRIVICADGTWNVRDQVEEETNKRRTGNVVDKFSGGAFGRGIEENVRQLYRFIVYN